jgi:hypothetical protein
MYREETGYEEVFIRKVRTQHRKTHTSDGLLSYVLQKDAGRKVQAGVYKDVLGTWKQWYRYKGLNKFARFTKTKVGFNVPYILFKAKNVTNPDIRQVKWMKARPIAPQTRHPMRNLLGKAGRAWYFAAVQLKQESFGMPTCREIPGFLEHAMRDLRPLGKVKFQVWDIEGCFPNMPKPAIRLAMRDIAKRHTENGFKGVWVPAIRSKPCEWSDRLTTSKGTIYKRRGTWMPWDVLMSTLEFTLDNAYIQMPDGRILRQVSRPMGSLWATL